MKEVTIYTDGACSHNPGPGGWGAILEYKGKRRELAGSANPTTNQRMELTAAIKALEALSESCRVRLYSDSAYLINAFKQNWFAGWQSRGWRNSKGEEVANRDLWEALLVQAKRHEVTWIKVKGHSGDEANERCDELARAAAMEAKQ